MNTIVNARYWRFTFTHQSGSRSASRGHATDLGVETTERTSLDSLQSNAWEALA